MDPFTGQGVDFMLMTAFVVLVGGASSAFMTHTRAPIHTHTLTSPGIIGIRILSWWGGPGFRVFVHQIMTMPTRGATHCTEICKVSTSAQNQICQGFVQLLCVAGAAVQMCRPAVHSCQDVNTLSPNQLGRPGKRA